MGVDRVIRELEESGKIVFSTKEFIRYAGVSSDVAYVYLNRLVDRGLVKRIKRGVYSLTNDIFLIANNIVKPSYFSFSTAFYLHGKFSYVINKLFLCNSKKSSLFLIDDNKVQFVRLKKNLMFGFVKKKRKNGYIFVAELEKALLDCIYLPRYCRIKWVMDVMRENIDYINLEKLEKFLELYKSEAVRRRLGYLLDLLNIKHEIRPESNTIYRLNPSIRIKGVLNHKWRLYINEVLS